jgi:hypothetical protein
MAIGQTIVNLGGEKRVIVFNNHFLPYLGDVLKTDPILAVEQLMLMAQSKPMRALTIIVYCGMMGYFESQAEYIHGIELKHVAGWVSDANDEDLLGVWEVFKQATGAPDASEEIISEYKSKLEALSESVKKKQKKA